MRRLLAAVVLVLTGCTGGVPEAAPPTSVERPAVDLPDDRDERAVTAALRRIDMCAVLSATAHAPNGYELRAEEPFSCEIDYPSENWLLPISLNVRFLSTDMRRMFPSPVFVGTKAYRDSDTICMIYFPVSFEYAIELSVGDRPCPYADGLAGKIATVLANPEKVSAEPRWTACEVMRSIPSVNPDHGLGMSYCTDSEDSKTLRFSYPDSYPRAGATRRKIGELDVWVSTGTDPKSAPCRIEWMPGRGDLVIEVSAPTCAEAESMVEPANRTLRQSTPDFPPQQPLLYPADEPDGPFVGACEFIDTPSPQSCAPHVKVPVPGGDDDLLESVDTNPDMACELALGSVTERFGKEMRAVTLDKMSSCYFVAPERKIQIEFSVSAATTLHDNRHIRDQRAVRIVGHPARRATLQNGYHFIVAASVNENDPGLMHLKVTTGPVIGSELPADTDDKAEQVLTDIVRKHFDG